MRKLLTFFKTQNPRREGQGLAGGWLEARVWTRCHAKDPINQSAVVGFVQARFLSIIRALCTTLALGAVVFAIASPVSAQVGGLSFPGPGGGGGCGGGGCGGALRCSYAAPVTTGTQGTAYVGATPVAAGGTPAYTFSETGTLPGGLSISSSTGVISGTPSASGSFPSIQVKVTDSTSTVANCGSAFTLVISPSGGSATLAAIYGDAQDVGFGTLYTTPSKTWSAGTAIVAFYDNLGGCTAGYTNVKINGVAATQVGACTAGNTVSLWTAAVTAGSGTFTVTAGALGAVASAAYVVTTTHPTPTGNVESDMTIVADPPGQTLGTALTIPTSGVGVFFALGSDCNGTTTPPTCTWTAGITNDDASLAALVQTSNGAAVCGGHSSTAGAVTPTVASGTGVRLLGNGRRHAGGWVSTVISLRSRGADTRWLFISVWPKCQSDSSVGGRAPVQRRCSLRRNRTLLASARTLSD
jgi:hypothetical protein